MGIFLIFLNFYWIARSRLLTAVKALSDLGRMSYLIFLVHYPILAFLMGPPVRRSIPPILILPLGLAFIFVMYYLCLLISKPMDRITAWLYNRPRMV
jgi:peptidoglycan/LPS O-acetylase OafA/YrhL